MADGSYFKVIERDAFHTDICGVEVVVKIVHQTRHDKLPAAVDWIKTRGVPAPGQYEIWEYEED